MATNIHQPLCENLNRKRSWNDTTESECVPNVELRSNSPVKKHRTNTAMFAPPSPADSIGGSFGRLEMGEEDEMMDIDSAKPTTPATPSSPPKQGGVGKFRLGYKADCEKCRMRVPGHYSHI